MTRAFEIKPNTLIRVIGWGLVVVFVWEAGDPSSAVLWFVRSIDWLHRNGAILIGGLVTAGIVAVFAPILIQNIKSEMKKAAAARAEAIRVEAARIAAKAAAKAERAAAWAEWRRQNPLAADVSEKTCTALAIAIVCCGAWWFYRSQRNQGFFPYSWTRAAVAADPPPRPRVDVYLHRGFGL
jgi:hypothetical protein